jgi:hypothetical protein
MKIILIFVSLKYGKNIKNLSEQPSGKPYQ